MESAVSQHAPHLILQVLTSDPTNPNLKNIKHETAIFHHLSLSRSTNAQGLHPKQECFDPVAALSIIAQTINSMWYRDPKHCGSIAAPSLDEGRMTWLICTRSVICED